MRRPFVYLATFVVAFAFGAGMAAFVADDAQAKPPIVCKLLLEPFYYCIEHPSCKGDQQRCWQCRGYDLSGEPCLCEFVGCMVP